MPGRGDGYELGQALDHAEDGRLDDIERHVNSAAERRGVRAIERANCRIIGRPYDPSPASAL
jgi:hypothetical protein